MLTNMERDVIENMLGDLGWIVNYNDMFTMTISQYSPAGEDLEFDLGCVTLDELEYCSYRLARDFEPDEHACEWYGQNRGEPSSLYELLEDARQIHKMLGKVYIAIHNYVKELKENNE